MRRLIEFILTIQLEDNNKNPFEEEDNKDWDDAMIKDLEEKIKFESECINNLKKNISLTNYKLEGLSLCIEIQVTLY